MATTKGPTKHRIAIFASGGGSNAQKIIEYFKESNNVDIGLVVSNRKKAGVITRAGNHQIESLILKKNSFYHTEDILIHLENYQITHIVLAGFLWLVPTYLINAYPQKIVNIHPALLPKFGGKGMYGMNVHRAVKEAAEKESGMTVHFVNANYDEGDIIAQHKCVIDQEDTAKEIANKVLELEHQFYPEIIDNTFFGR